MVPPGEAQSVGRPAKPGDWVVVARSTKVAAAWNQLANGAAGEMQRVYDQLAKQPDRDDGDRQHPLEGKAGRGTFKGVDYVRWQIDVTSGGRIWYFIDRTPSGSGQKRRSGTVIIDQVHSGHPKTTEKRPTGKRRPGRT